MQNNMLILVTLVMLSAVSASAQSAAELLEKGIYLEETAGQVEEAIEIYRRITGDATADRAYVAEALLRLGTCHLKQGDAVAAAAAFDRLRTEYPEQEGLVARAREHMPGEEPLELLPAPWEDGEVIRMTVGRVSGVPLGVLFMTADAAELDGEELWRLQIRHKFFFDTRNQTVRQVLARRDSMAPVSSFYRYPGVGHFEARYDDGKVSIDTVETGAKREEKLDGPTFDAEELYHLLRRLPLEVGAKQTIRLISTMAGAANALEVEIAGKEMITVPAGELECYRLELAMLGVFWVSTDPSRILVKLDAAGLVAELEEVYVREPGRQTTFRDEELGFGVNLPPDWLFHRRDDEGSEIIYLLDPQAETQARMEVRRATGDVAPAPLRGDDCFFQTAATRKLGEARGALRDNALRDGTWDERYLAGWPAISFASDYRDMEREMVHYWTFIESGELCASFTLKVAADRYEELRTVFDSIIESYRGPPPPAMPPVAAAESETARAVRSVLADFHLAASEADPQRFFEHLAPDAIFFGPGAADRFDLGQLRERFADAVGWIGEPPLQASFRGDEPHVMVSEDGTLAWFDGRLDSRRLGELRASGVLRAGRRPAEGWEIVQYHLAMPVPNPLVAELHEKLRAPRGKKRNPPDGSADDPAAAARSVLNDVHRARFEVDGERFLGHFAPDAILLGTDRSERLTMARNRAFVRLYWARDQGPTSTPIEQHVYLSPDGNLAWFEELVDREHVGQVRTTGVIAEIDGTWKFVHYNLVILVAQEMAEELAARIEAFYAPG